MSDEVCEDEAFVRSHEELFTVPMLQILDRIEVKKCVPVSSTCLLRDTYDTFRALPKKGRRRDKINDWTSKENLRKDERSVLQQGSKFEPFYGVEAWTLKMNGTDRLEAFEVWTYKMILKISWVDRMTNDDEKNTEGRGTYLPSDSEDYNISDSDDEYAPRRPTSKDAPASDNENTSTSESEDDEPLSSLVAKGKKKYKWTRVKEEDCSGWGTWKEWVKDEYRKQLYGKHHNTISKQGDLRKRWRKAVMPDLKSKSIKD
ncbi:hypothetical protein FQA39_LY03375 [Lamprigera yunnana]|nr:hypothetical protein FQA39_LY03375 [Lamprigera yunnana]